MKLLAIDTATRQLGVALLEEERLIASYELLVDYPHAVELPAAVNRVLEAGHAALRDLDAVVVDIGPGSFTGLRIGLAFVKALVFPIHVASQHVSLEHDQLKALQEATGVSKTRGISVIGVPSLDVLAAGLPFTPQPVCPMLDARQKNVYAALYQVEGGRASKQADYFLGPVADALKRVTDPRTVFLGDGCAVYRERILERFPQAQFAASEWWLPRAATLARLGRERFLQGHRDDPSRLVPLYLYPHDCQVRSPERPTSVLGRSPQPA